MHGLVSSCWFESPSPLWHSLKQTWTLQPVILALLHSCRIVVLYIRLSGYSCYCVHPCGSAPLLFRAIEVVIALSLCFTLCAQPHITPEFALCAILQPHELCKKHCNSYNLLEKFMQLYAFVSRIQNWTLSSITPYAPDARIDSCFTMLHGLLK